MRYQQLLEIIPAKPLNEVFQVFGHFYSVSLLYGEKIEALWEFAW